MNAPRLRPLNPQQVAQHPGLIWSDQAPSKVFEVLAAGRWRGQWFERGDVITCESTTQSGDVVVLEDRFGRPRLGSIRGRSIFGDRGEPCSPQWWSTAGRLESVYRLVGLPSKQGEWRRIQAQFPDAVITPTRAGALRRDQRRPVRGGASRSSRSQQLCLFAA